MHLKQTYHVKYFMYVGFLKVVPSRLVQYIHIQQYTCQKIEVIKTQGNLPHFFETKLPFQTQPTCCYVCGTLVGRFSHHENWRKKARQPQQQVAAVCNAAVVLHRQVAEHHDLLPGGEPKSKGKRPFGQKVDLIIFLHSGTTTGQGVQAARQQPTRDQVSQSAVSAIHRLEEHSSDAAVATPMATDTKVFSMGRYSGTLYMPQSQVERPTSNSSVIFFTCFGPNSIFFGKSANGVGL